MIEGQTIEAVAERVIAIKIQKSAEKSNDMISAHARKTALRPPRVSSRGL